MEKHLMTIISKQENFLIQLATVLRMSFLAYPKVFEMLEAQAYEVVASSSICRMLQDFPEVKYLSKSPFIEALKICSTLPLSSCIAIGSIKEAEIARSLGQISQASVGRLVRLATIFSLPHKIDRALVDTNSYRLALKKLMGGDIQPLIERVIADAVTIEPRRLNQENSSTLLRVPGSKSISNRALLLAGVSEGICIIRGFLLSDDTQVMMEALSQLGASFTWLENGSALLVKGNGGRFFKPTKPLWVANAGTATRFLIPFCSLVQDPSHKTVMHGSNRMQQRPQGDLVECLRSNGAKIDCIERDGHLPLSIQGGGLLGGHITLAGKVSSQFVSAILLAAPYAHYPVELTLLETEPTSIAYIEMTIAMMAEFGITVERIAINAFRVPKGIYKGPQEYEVEADASSATYLLACAALTPARTVTVEGVGINSLQGDAQFCHLLQAMGATITQTKDSTTVTGSFELHSPHTSGGAVNMSTMTDAFLTAATCAVVSEGSTRIVGIKNQHVKECDRIAALVAEFAKCNIASENHLDGITIHGNPRVSIPLPVYLDTHDDHRIAMSMAVLGSVIPNLVITNKDCTDKTYPHFFDDLANHLKTEVSAFPKNFPIWTSQSLVLIGMRGAGKTTLGQLAAEYLGWNFIDLDEVAISHFAAGNCSEIIAKIGWQQFREIESQLFIKVLEAHSEGCVIACGGGLVEHPVARKKLQEWYPVIHMQRNFDAIIDTLKQEHHNRAPFGESIEAVWKRRKPWYEECSQFDFYSIEPGDFTRLLKNMRELEPRDGLSGSMIVDIDIDWKTDYLRTHLAVLRAKNPKVDLVLRFHGYDCHTLELLNAAARTGCEGLILPKKSVSTYPAADRGRVLSFFGPVRVYDQEEDSWFDKAINQYPGKSACKLDSKEMYYLFGNPIVRSPSPVLHNTAFKLFGQTQKRYEIFETSDIDRIHFALSSPSCRGASITIPHKQSIRGLARISNDALAIGAVNTIIKTSNGDLEGHNTDWIGIRNCLTENRCIPEGSTVLVVGAGATARSASYCVKSLNLNLLVYHRDSDKAKNLASEFGGSIVEYESQNIGSSLVAIISTIPAEAEWTASVEWLASRPIVLDVCYRPKRTKLLEQAEKFGCETISGIDLLLKQGFEQVKIFQSCSIEASEFEKIELNVSMREQIQKEVLAHI